jgi:hypothetical protein
MAQTEEKRLLLRTISILTILLGIVLTAYTATRLGHGAFPFGQTKIVKIILGICLAFAGWFAISRKTRELGYRLLTLFYRLFKLFLFPPIDESSYSQVVRALLTFLMFVGIGMVFWAMLKPPVKLDVQFLYRYSEMGLGGIALALTSGFLRYSKKSGFKNVDWPKPIEILLVFSLALVVTAIDVYFSSKIGLLANPPYQDGVGYMLEAKKAFLQFGLWKTHTVAFANMMFGNRYPAWQTLMVLNFKLLGEGEWQAYAVRFWPTFVILLTVFCVVCRHIGTAGAWAAAILTSLLPTLSLNLHAASVGHHSTIHGYLTDLRPDLLFAAFLLSAVTFLIEHAQTLDEKTALLSGASAALAVLAKSSAVGALLLAWGIAMIYVLIVQWRTRKNFLSMAAWALLAFTVLLLPWALAGGAAMTFQYIKNVMTVELPLYSNPHATLESELTYYGTWFLPHMGFLGLIALVLGIILFLIFLVKKKRGELDLHRFYVYLTTGAALYVLVSISLAKNYFLALPCYFILWIFSLNCLAAAINLAQGWKTKLSWSFLSLGLFYAAYLGVVGTGNLAHWPSYDSQEGPHNRMVMREIAKDLRNNLSNDDSFMWIPAYGNPATLLYYMMDQQGKLPTAIEMDAMIDPQPEQYVRKFIEPAKAVLVYRDSEESVSVGYVHPANYPYFRAITAWVSRPGSSHHLFKSYHFLDVDGNLKPTDLTIDLYVRDPARPGSQDQIIKSEIARPLADQRSDIAAKK